SGSSALARAQAQLAGERVAVNFTDSKDELQEYMNALTKKTSALRVSKSSGPGLSDLSDISLAETDSLGTKGNRPLKSSSRAAGSVGENLSTTSRFLKKKQNVEENQSVIANNMVSANKTGAVTQKLRPSSAALTRLEQIENRVMNRKLVVDLMDTDTDLWTSDERPFSAQSSSDLSGRGNRFLEKKTQVSESIKTDSKQAERTLTFQGFRPKTAGHRVVPDSDEELKKLIGNSMDSSDDNQELHLHPAEDPPIKVSPPSQGSPPRAHSRLGSHHISSRSVSPPSGDPPRAHSRLWSHPNSSRSVSPPSRGSPHRSLYTAASRSPSPPSKGSHSPHDQSPRRKFLKQSQSVSERSEVKSLDELFSEPSEADDVKTESSDVLKNVRLNILSLDDLMPALPLDTEGPAEGREERKALTRERASATVAKRTKALFQAGELQTTEEPLKPLDQSDIASEISECLEGGEPVAAAAVMKISDESQECSPHCQSTACSDYSDDFERSVRFEENKRKYSQSFSSHTSSFSSSSSSSLQTSQSTGNQRNRRKSSAQGKEAAVQTEHAAFTYSWANDGGTAVLGPSHGMMYVDPTPIASHIVSPDAVEALTAYSPAIFALNDMLRNQLLLTKEFVKISSHLHASVVNSLERDPYHYTTLAEVKQFIRENKAPPLTVEAALEEVLQ
uniref:Chromosome 19 open reading frame 44 n=1 Tax=Latimeria chalumnae TaxID=7897 RepID=H3BFU6_LATCH